MSALTWPVWLNAFATQIRAREGVAADSEIAVYTGPIPAGTPWPRKAIVFSDCEDTVEPASIGPIASITHRERYIAEGWCAGSSPLAGEDGVVAARAACAAALEHVHQQLRTDPTVSNTAEWARLASVDWRQGVDADRGRVCVALFTVAVEARI